VTWFYRHFVRPALFSQDSEYIHNFTIRLLNRVSRTPELLELGQFLLATPYLPSKVFGLEFPNPVGLAAGMDKAGAAVPAWAAMSFGFSELGGITFHPQPGNDPPRMFRAIGDRALVNRMGFNNPGAEAFAQALSDWKSLGRWPAHPIGVNLGKSKITPLDKAAEDYAGSFRLLRDLADFFVVNVSSPNTPNLRQLQDKAALEEIFAALQQYNEPIPKPILVKVAPDLSFDALDQILELALTRRISGIVATNTTISRPESRDPDCSRVYGEMGGLSGAPLAARSTDVIRHLYRQSRGSLPIIGVGGIFDAADAWEKICAGASLIQVYTGLVYEGPAIARTIVKGLVDQLRRTGCRTLTDAVGLEARKPLP